MPLFSWFSCKIYKLHAARDTRHTTAHTSAFRRNMSKAGPDLKR